MHRAKAFFFVCAGIFLLALSYHLGARTAAAQAPSTVTGFAYASGQFFVLTPNGDVFSRDWAGGSLYPNLVYLGNFWSGSGPVPAQRSTFGALKSRYRGAPGGAQPTTQDR